MHANRYGYMNYANRREYARGAVPSPAKAGMRHIRTVEDGPPLSELCSRAFISWQFVMLSISFLKNFVHFVTDVAEVGITTS